MDLMVALPKSPSGKDAIVVFVDRLSKRVHMAPVSSGISAPELARVFLDTVFKHHGMPETLVCDRDSKFVSAFWQTLFSLMGTTLNISTAYHPQTDGQTERTNRQLEQVLRHYINPQHSNWEELLPVVEYAVNAHTSASTGFTPFYLDTGMTPHTPLALAASGLLPAGTPHTTQSVIEEWKEALAAAQVAMRLAQDRYAAHADLSRIDSSYKMGDKVWLSSEHVTLHSRPSKKFRERWLGPFVVKRVVSPVAYELDLPHRMKLHHVFHVAVLKPHVEDPVHPPPAQPPNPVINEDGEEEYVVQEILEHRVRKIHGRHKLELLVRWEGYGPEHDDWLPVSECEELAAYDVYIQEMLRTLGPNGWPPEEVRPQAPSTAPPAARGRQRRS
jgi:hypothetical protein